MNQLGVIIDVLIKRISSYILKMKVLFAMFSVVDQYLYSFFADANYLCDDFSYV